MCCTPLPPPHLRLFHPHYAQTQVLIMRHLVDAGYVESYERLCGECNVSLQKVGVRRSPVPFMGYVGWVQCAAA